MAKVVGGFLIGFFLAVMLVFLFIYVQLAPYSSQITFAYQISQSEWFNTVITSFLDKLKDLPGLSIIGEYAGVAEQIGGFMMKINQTIGVLYLILKYSIPAIVISIIMIIIGGFVASRPEAKIMSKSIKRLKNEKKKNRSRKSKI